ncbi:MAG: T9SS type A sorting domain-containing protein [Saprospiraceae bacterium]
MKKKLLLYSFVIFIIQLPIAQTNLLTESFETNGEGTRYSTNTFFVSCNDLFERSTNGGVYCMTNEPTNINGTFYWSGEDCDVASGGTGILTLNPITVTGYNLEMKVLLGVERPNDGRFEFIDELLFEYNMDGNGWNTFAAFYGNNNVTANGNLQEDSDLDGTADPGGAEISTTDFTDWTFSIPVTGNSLQVRFIMGQDQGTEGVMLDNIRIEGTVAMPIDLTEFSVRKMEEDKVKINWQTASEENNEYFLIQRSKDGSSWEDIRKVKGAGNSTLTIDYSIVDEKPFSGVSYYRLKQVDFNGDFEFSNIKSVSLEIPNSKYSIFPNPTSSGKFNIEIPNDKTEIQILDRSGQLIYQAIKDKGISEISLQEIQTGIYFVKFIHAEKMEVQKLILEIQ